MRVFNLFLTHTWFIKGMANWLSYVSKLDWLNVMEVMKQ